MTQDMLDRELRAMDLKQVFKISRDAIRKNHYRHMHAKTTPAAGETESNPATSSSAVKAQPGSEVQQRTTGPLNEDLKSVAVTRKADVQSEMRIRVNDKAKSVARNILSSDQQNRKTSEMKSQMGHTRDSSSKLYQGDRLHSGQQKSEPAHQYRSVNRSQKQQWPTLDGTTFGSSGLKITSNDDQIRIRILKEGKAYTRKFKVVDEKKTSAATDQQSAFLHQTDELLFSLPQGFTAHYNAQKTSANSSNTFLALKSSRKDQAGKQMFNVYTEKLPAIAGKGEQKQTGSGTRRGVKSKAVSVGAPTKNTINAQQLTQPESGYQHLNSWLNANKANSNTELLSKAGDDNQIEQQQQQQKATAMSPYRYPPAADQSSSDQLSPHNRLNSCKHKQLQQQQTVSSSDLSRLWRSYGKNPRF